MSLRVLVVEQSDSLRDSFANTLLRAGFDVLQAKTIPEAAEQFASHGAAIVVLDLLMIGGDPLLYMAGIMGAFPNVRVIATTASGAMRQAGLAIEQGAFDYLVKPIDTVALISVVRNAARVIASDTIETLGAADAARHAALFGSSLKAMTHMAPSQAPILIEGEAGTGKRECARAMHDASHRAALPFVEVDCSHIAHLSLSSVFTKKLMTGGGTVYLAEPSRLPLMQQTQLLRFLQSGVLDFDTEGLQYGDVRVMCGMSTLPEDAVDAGRLREDLFYRLKVMRISLQPLRNRRDQIPALANALLQHIAARTQSPLTMISEEAGNILAKLPWAGNVTELQSVITRCVQTEKGPVLNLEMLSDVVPKEMNAAGMMGYPTTDHFIADSADNTVVDLIRAGWSLADLERLFIETAIAHNDGSIPKTAAQLDVSPSTLYRKKETWQ